MSCYSCSLIYSAGAQYNVVPMSLYEKATGDYERRFVTPETLRNTGEDIHRGIWGK